MAEPSQPSFGMDLPPPFIMMLPDECATDRLGHAIASVLRPGDIVALDGPLGAGKTRLARAIAIAGGADPALIHSPTYVLANEYPLTHPVARIAPELRVLIHIDAYRLDEHDEVAGLIDPDESERGGAAVVIEWAERLRARGPSGPLAGRESLCVRLSHEGVTARLASLSGPLAAAVAERAGRADPSWRSPAGDPRADPVRSRPCRTCGEPADERAEHFPFCSQRCQMVDFGRWLDGDYRISREIKDSDLDAGD